LKINQILNNCIIREGSAYRQANLNSRMQSEEPRDTLGANIYGEDCNTQCLEDAFYDAQYLYNDEQRTTIRDLCNSNCYEKICFDKCTEEDTSDNCVETCYNY